MASKTGAAKVPVALPKSNDSASSPAATSASGSLIGQDSALYNAIGARVTVTTSAIPRIEGTIYTADPMTSLLILETSSSPNTAITPQSLTAPPGNYRLIPISQITSFTILSSGPANTSSSQIPTPAPQIDTAAATARLNTAIANAQAALSRQGPRGTSRRDQALFDALARTHPARWEGNSMVISDSFLIEKPYSSATTTTYTGGAGGQQGGHANGNTFKGDLTRFRNIVDMELKKAEFRLQQADLDARVVSGGGGAGEGERKGG
ncbi:uncharacterized protein AB675_5220 [Cyphellophora attinorum]|uniref:AD domain-containing protein n=1 Tax=Cyphellophora attinorum TaxID=1664694 RepID=A0A0N1HA61_9EURO|nr:uncharacterized protein AB675_5220 [Phialophora attinorum]KPI39375.1 hypothetical protein AB675_5220 [Phialophora attinorum]